MQAASGVHISRCSNHSARQQAYPSRPQYKSHAPGSQKPKIRQLATVVGLVARATRRHAQSDISDLAPAPLAARL